MFLATTIKREIRPLSRDEALFFVRCSRGETKIVNLVKIMSIFDATAISFFVVLTNNSVVRM